MRCGARNSATSQRRNNGVEKREGKKGRVNAL